MSCKFINVLMFAAGAAIGSAVTWKVVKNKYERIAQEEIDSVTKTFANNFDYTKEQNDSTPTEDESDECPVVVPGQINWDDLEDLNEEDDDPEEELNTYVDLASNYTNEKGGAENMAKAPYVIAPYDFGELDEYSQIELTYYSDGTLEDDEYNIVTDIDELIGPKALTTFGEYEEDAVFVRNERLSTDFQILKDYRTYEEARRVGPDRVGDE